MYWERPHSAFIMAHITVHSLWHESQDLLLVNTENWRETHTFPHWGNTAHPSRELCLPHTVHGYHGLLPSWIHLSLEENVDITAGICQGAYWGQLCCCFCVYTDCRKIMNANGFCYKSFCHVQDPKCEPSFLGLLLLEAKGRFCNFSCFTRNIFILSLWNNLPSL